MEKVQKKSRKQEPFGKRKALPPADPTLKEPTIFSPLCMTEN